MKYTITINQKKAVELCLTIDETILLTCVHDLLPLSGFAKNEKNQVWITHKLFSTEYPLLKLGRTTLYKKLYSLVERDFLTKTEKITQSKKMNFYGLTKKSELLFTDSHVQKMNFTSSESEHAHVQKVDFTCSESEHYHNTNYPYTINHNTIIQEKNIKKEKNIEREQFFSEIPNSLKELIIEHELFKKNKNSKNYEYTKHIINKLKRLGNNNFVQMENIVLQSLENSWTGLFAVNGNVKANNRNWSNIDVESNNPMLDYNRWKRSIKNEK